MRILSWDEFDRCITSITHSCKSNQFSGVYGFPRGGLCMAVALSHAMEIPFLDELKPGCLVVDDVYETGSTLKKALDIPKTTHYVWFSKVTPQWWHAVEIVDPDEWLVFPWESRNNAENDMIAYQSTRF